MHILAEGLIASGGPSAPVWAFFTAISIGILGIIGQQISSKRAASDAKVEASKAAKNAQKAQENTAGISNGFAGRMDRKLDSISAEQIRQGNAIRKHLEWHLQKEDD